MNTVNLSALILAVSLPCAAAPEPAPEYSAKHKETASKLAGQQDELQADTSDLILGETNENVVDLLKKCRHAMNDAVDLLEVYNTGGQTLAAQSDVIELIYQAAKAKMTGAGGQPKPGGQALMDMLRQLLGMDNDSQSEEQQTGREKRRRRTERLPEKQGNNPGHGADGKSNMASTQRRAFPIRTWLRKRAPFPNPPACPRTTCPPNSARRWTPTTKPFRSKHARPPGGSRP